VFEEVETAFSRFNPILDEIAILENRLADSNEQANTDSMLIRLHELQEELLESVYWQRVAVIEQILTGLGFSVADFNRTCGQFSGGWQMRIALAKVLAEDPDIMLLDEPTNYLDIEARIWLKNYLGQYDGGLMIVSHDQSFLDETINEVYELFNGKLTRYGGNYSFYLNQREMEIKQLEEAYRLTLQKREKTEQFVERFRYKATKAKQVQSRIKQLEKLEPVQLPAHLRSLSFSFPNAPHCGNIVTSIEHLEKRYDEHVIFDDFSIVVNKGDRLAVTGRNGAGKSTLLRLIAAIDTDYRGTIALGSQVKIGYFAQDVEHTLEKSRTVLEEAESVASTADIPKLRSMLGSFLFTDDDVFKRVGILSGGERSRLALLKILLQPANLLILDEPTNHLDINAKKMLLDALKSYDGTVVFVSHDSHFIKHLATRILYLNEGNVPELFEGDYEYFSWKLEQKEQFERIRPRAKEDATLQPVKVQTTDRREANRQKNRLRNLKIQSQELLEQTEAVERQISHINVQMALPENYSDNEKITTLVKSLKEHELLHESLSQQWFSLHEEIESLEGAHAV
ncbi:MAG: ABC-F family ATP-binding cassette domain-containing protein, partial [Sphaerochaetaceae bacterium]|nr:ABC-F family ATP-binding cassette domain-containing protein [Sphaerochaetaceae bacterium]